MPMPSQVADDFAGRLDVALKTLNISRAQLASQVGVDKSLISRWLSGRMRPSSHNLTRISEVLARARPGFNTLHWERPRSEFEAFLGIATPIPAALPMEGAEAGILVPRRASAIAGGVWARRGLLASALGLAAARGAVSWFYQDRPRPPADIADLVDHARELLLQGGRDDMAQATGLLQHATEKRPDSASGWGLLAMSYALDGLAAGPEQSAIRARADEAIARALALDPANPDALAARVARAAFLPSANRIEFERGLRAILADHPDHPFAILLLGNLLLATGRCREAADLLDGGWQHMNPNPRIGFTRVVALWAAKELGAADAAASEIAKLFPMHQAVWFTRYYLLLYTGRASQALAMGLNVDGRPPGVPDRSFAMTNAVAQAMISRTPDDIARAIALNVKAAHQATGFALNTIQFASALGRLDTAFEVARGCYFGERFAVASPFKYSRQEGRLTLGAPETKILFYPSTEAMRRDARFPALVDALGLGRYWAKAGKLPDYRRGRV